MVRPPDQVALAPLVEVLVVSLVVVVPLVVGHRQEEPRVRHPLAVAVAAEALEAAVAAVAEAAPAV